VFTIQCITVWKCLYTGGFSHLSSSK
jgi:hypothetical protein